MSTGWNYRLRKVDVQNELNGGTWRIVANWGCGLDDGLHGGNPLLVVDHFNDINWRGVCKTRWWWQRVKTMVAVTVFILGGSCGGADG